MELFSWLYKPNQGLHMGVDTMKERAMEFLRDLLKTTMFKRRAFFAVADILLIGFAIYASFWIRFDWIIQDKYLQNLSYYILLVLAVNLGFLLYYYLHGISWRFFSLIEKFYLYL